MQVLASVLRNKLVLAVLGAAIVGSGAYAFAATLNVSSGTLQAGNITVAQCQGSTPLATSFTTVYSGGGTNPNAYVVGNVKVTGIQLACVTAGATLNVQLTKSDGTALGTQVAHTLVTGDDTAGVTTSFTTQNVKASDVASVNASIAS